jgi:hypothetical protein
MALRPSIRSPSPFLTAAILLAAVGIGALAWAGRERLAARGLFPNSDFLTYYKAGAMVRTGIAGRALYPEASPGESAVSRMFGVDRAAIRDLNRRLPSVSRLPEDTYQGFAYPPFAALLFVPFTWLPVEAAGVVWRVILVLLSAWALHRLWKVLTERGVPAPVATGIMLACVATWPFVYSLRMGQAGQLLFVAVAIAMAAVARGRFAAAGAALALGALIKLLPAIALPVFFRGATRRAWLSAALVGVAGLLAAAPFVSPFVAARYFASLAPHLHTAAGRANNQSVLGLVSHLTMSPESRSRLLEHPELMPDAVAIASRVAAAGLTLLALGACAGIVARSTQVQRRPLTAAVAIMAAIAPLVTPLSWPFTYVMALPAYALGLAWLYGDSRLGVVPRVAVAAGLQLLWLFPPTALPEDFGRTAVERVLLNPTVFAGAATAVLAWAWGRAGERRAA